MTPVTLLLASILLTATAVAMAVILGWANRAFHVEVDPKVEAIENILPSANCGGCGYIGCSDYAEAVARGEADVTLCGPGGAGCAKRIAEIMGVEVRDTYPYRAVVHCAATLDQRLGQSEYIGEATCAAANLVAGFQGCVYGCLGLGDCVAACDYDAIHIRDGLAVIDYEACTGCKACSRVCPRNIVSMVPFKSDRMLVVACSNQDFANDVKAVCKVGCTGCQSCTRKNPLFSMEDNLPVIHYEDYDPAHDFIPILEKCKMESLIFVGQPEPEDLAAVASEEVPERITAEFKTTVDDSDWWG
ncbi:MAG: RnfABCDGE type electron transport complex subunit B [Candidatus Omnitrophica bacterium]|nr:RnfABCDGE type electron transport complex subunit B [Candidatus Omnitrophota bacterium]MCA9441118.1 RnfABCDGE type electron transport complex subunit B [Candidatus Omnitrophota bacterium]